MELSYDAICFDLFGTLVEEDGRAIDGARQAMAAVPADRCAIVTSCGAKFARTLLMTAQLPIPAILISADEVERSKPAPDGYAMAAQRLGIEPSKILALEDSRHGMAAARAAGMDVVGIVGNHGPPNSCEALYAVKRLADVRWGRGIDGSVTVRLS